MSAARAHWLTYTVPPCVTATIPTALQAFSKDIVGVAFLQVCHQPSICMHSLALIMYYHCSITMMSMHPTLHRPGRCSAAILAPSMLVLAGLADSTSCSLLMAGGALDFVVYPACLHCCAECPSSFNKKPQLCLLQSGSAFCHAISV